MEIEKVLKKLRFKTEHKNTLVNAPENMVEEFTKGGLSPTVDSEGYEFTLLFVTNKEEMNKWFPKVIKRIVPDSVFWLAYPKGRSKIKTDINRDKLWELMKPLGYRSVSMVSIDETWSAMRVRLADRVKPR